MEKLYIRDAVLGDIPIIRDIEEPIINSWEFQRLRYIRQLQLTYLVYPSANHTRFEHSLGVMHTSGEFIDIILENSESLEIFKKIAGTPLISDQAFKNINRIVVRLAGLLHDIGHGPFGHLFDSDVIPNIISDKEKRKELKDKKCFSHELISFLVYYYRFRDIIERNLNRTEYRKYTEEIISWLDQVLVPLCKNDQELYIKMFKINSNGYGYFLRMIVRDFLYPADLLDFLVRDSFYTGTIEHGMINKVRLMRNTVAIPKETAISSIRNTKSVPDKTINEIERFRTPIILAIRSEKIIPDILRFLYARRLMYENVYFHPAVKVFNWSAANILRNVLPQPQIGFNEKQVLSLMDNLTNKEHVNRFLDLYLSFTDDILLKIKELYIQGEIKNPTIKLDIESIFINRKPRYRLLHRELIAAKPAPVLSKQPLLKKNDLEKRILNELENLGLISPIDSRNIFKIKIDVITIFPGSSWVLQGPYIFEIIDGNVQLITVSDFSSKFLLSNMGEVRLYIDRQIYDSSRFTKSDLNKIRLGFSSIIRSQVYADQLKTIVKPIVISSVTM